MIQDETQSPPDITCMSLGYDQFLQSLHCQFFHTDSSLYSHPGFQVFIRNVAHLIAEVMNRITSVFTRINQSVYSYLGDLFHKTPLKILNFMASVCTSMNTITVDAGSYLKVLFDGPNNLIPCKELMEMSAALQVGINLLIDHSVSDLLIGIQN